MEQPTYKTLGGIKVNGRVHYYDHLTNLKRVSGSRSRWTVMRRDVEYRIEGGRHAGGGRREWWLEGGDFNGPINCTSLVDALNCLEHM
jgi:hypothetical protein